MKTNQLILAAALVVLAACNKTNVDTNVAKLEGDEIGFVAVNKKATKANDAIITTAAYAEDNSFRLWGWQSATNLTDLAANAASNFMSNLKIEFCDGPDGRANAWRNDEHYYYWPFTGKLSFLAIHPYEIASATTKWDATNVKPQAAIADYTITPGTNETVDLMFATNEGTRESVLAGDGKVAMVFKHALSQIVVNVKTDDDYTRDVKFDVNSVEFNNIDLSGDVAYVNDAISWTNNDGQTQNWMYYNTILENINKTSQIYGAAKVNIPQPANDDKSRLDPSDANYDASDKGATLTISYTMKQGAGEAITGTVIVADPFLSVAANAWEAGKKYNYTLNFRLNEILFNPSVTEWVNVDVTTINIY